MNLWVGVCIKVLQRYPVSFIDILDNFKFFFLIFFCKITGLDSQFKFYSGVG